MLPLIAREASDPSMETDPREDTREDREDVEQGGYRLELPDDGYEWRKYGQKFIKNIGKFRSYFRCRRQDCSAKKRVEWSSFEPDNLRIVYGGVHSHASDAFSLETETPNDVNQYNLLTQVLAVGDPPSSFPPPPPPPQQQPPPSSLN